MAKVSREKIDRVNSKCKNNWKFDTEYYLCFSKNALFKYIKIDEQHFLQFTLKYNTEKQIILRITKFDYNTETGLLSTSGLGKIKVLNETQAKRENINNLIELANKFSDDELLEMNKQTKVNKSNGLLLESEEF